MAKAKLSPEFVHDSDSDNPETQSDSQATALSPRSSSLTSEEDWDPPEKVLPPSPVATAMQAPKAKQKCTGHDLNGQDKYTVTKTGIFFVLFHFNMHITMFHNINRYYI
jgi:hypothetical protein